jgi:predicted O-methyltransferase YrrM
VVQVVSINTGAFAQLEQQCARRLAGEAVWNVLQEIERLNSEWVVTDAPPFPSYGRLPGEQEIRPWSVPQSTGALLYFLVHLCKAQTVLEIGTSLGYSGLWLASALQETGGHLWTCENFAPKIDLARKHFAAANQRNVTLAADDACRVVETWDRPIDLLFLDADPENYDLYWHHLKRSLRPQGILVMDNARNHDEVTAPFYESLIADGELESLLLPFDNGLYLLRKTSGSASK